MSSTSSASTERRQTRQRSIVQAVLQESDAFRSAQDLHQDLRERGERVGLSTVYRNLQMLAETDEVDTLRNEDGEVLYRVCSPKHHHHLVCRECGTVKEVRGPAVETWAERSAAEHGFTDVAHTVEIFGVCARCSAR